LKWDITLNEGTIKKGKKSRGDWGTAAREEKNKTLLGRMSKEGGATLKEKNSMYNKRAKTLQGQCWEGVIESSLGGKTLQHENRKQGRGRGGI